MALRSALEGLGTLKRPCEVTFVSDSKYLVDGITKWVHGWRTQGWKKKGGPIQNLELWQALYRLAGRHDVTWRWVKGHAGHARNEYANDLAVMAAQEQTRSGGPVESRFTAWLGEQREKNRYVDFVEFTPPVLPD